MLVNSATEFWAHKKRTNNLENKLLATNLVDPWGVEPQSKEPESFILSIELWVLNDRLEISLKIYMILISPFLRCKSSEIFVSLQKSLINFHSSTL